MSFNIAGIGVGEGGGRLAMAMVESGANISCINTNKGDLAGLTKIPESKKLLLEISGGGSGKEPTFVRDAMKSPELRNQVVEFIKRMLDNTPIFTNCSSCGSKEKLRDTEAVGEMHICSACGKSFGITQIVHEEAVKHDYLFLFACLGGGSGSGLINEVVAICHQKFNLPIAVICTLPDDSEDTTTKINAVAVFKELYNNYAVSGIVSPLILVDNQKMMELYNHLPIGKMYPTINNSIAGIIDKFNSFSNQTSEYMSTIDTMDTARLWSLGGCCAMGKFIVGNSKKPSNSTQVVVPHPLDLDMVEEALQACNFVDGFDLTSAKGVGIIAVGPEHYMQDENISKCIRYAFGKAKEVIGDGLVFRGQYTSLDADCLEFYVFFNGLKYPEARFERLWNDIKEGKTISARKRERIDEVPYDISIEPGTSGNNFAKVRANVNAPAVKEEPTILDTVVEKPVLVKRTCTNCYIDPVTKKSMGVYNKRGPAPFSGKVCPICKGEGKA